MPPVRIDRQPVALPERSSVLVDSARGPAPATAHLQRFEACQRAAARRGRSRSRTRFGARQASAVTGTLGSLGARPPEHSGFASHACCLIGWLAVLQPALGWAQAAPPGTRNKPPSVLGDEVPRLQAPRFEPPALEAETEESMGPESERPESEGPESELPPESGGVPAADATPPTVPTEMEGLGAEPSDVVPGPGELQDRLTGAKQPGPGEPRPLPRWTAPRTIMTLHGYMRARGEVLNNFWLGRDPNVREVNDAERAARALPFSRFRPLERNPVLVTEGDALLCDKPDGSTRECDVDTLGYANLRLRLAPELHLSEDIRVKMLFDVFDNLVAGSTPASFYVTGDPALGAPGVDPRLRARRDPFVSTALPPGTRGFRLGEGILARRAWAEVRNRDLGELRFGRMPNAWGLGMVAHAGNGLDDDFSSDVDRLMAVAKLAGLYVMAAYDYEAEGIVESVGPHGLPYDVSQLDDVDQYTFFVARRMSDKESRTALNKGRSVLSYGAYLQYRKQVMAWRDDTSGAGDATSGAFVRLNASRFTWDAWAQFRRGGLRIEAEAALVHGGLLWPTGNAQLSQYSLFQFGAALETEYRLLDDKLGLYLYAGVASGDDDVEGLSADNDVVTQLRGRTNATDDSVSTFRFHPNYRVDLILWRSLMRQISGAYYLKPGLSYDLIRTVDGERLGGRVDAIWSRATNFVQTWGNEAHLGLELNAALYWRTEGGPELVDGYRAMVQYGVLFPGLGLGYLRDSAAPSAAMASDDVRKFEPKTAQTLRLVLGVVF